MITGFPSCVSCPAATEQSTGITGFNVSARATASVTQPLHNSYSHPPSATYSLQVCFLHGTDTKENRKQSTVLLKY